MNRVISSGEFYADVAERVGNAILAGDFDRGILCCGTLLSGEMKG